MSINTPLVESKFVVAKFGGTSVKDYPAMLRCANIVLNNSSNTVTVVSASAGVTNLLIELTDKETKLQRAEDILAEIKQTQLRIIEELPNEQENIAWVDNVLQVLWRQYIGLSETYSLKTADSMLSTGEQLSSYLFVQVLKQIKGNSRLIKSLDAKDVITTDSQFSKAKPDLEQIKSNAETQIIESANSIKSTNQKTIFVTQGFIGQDSFGNTTTLGRGGSDFSAALIAEAIKASELQIWTDVAGIYSSDPRKVRNARPIKTLSFNEAAELATFGAKVLHPATLLPAIRAKIEVFIGSSIRPEDGGTRLTNDKGDAGVRAIALREDQTLVTLSSPNMLLASGFLARVFAILAKYEVSVDLITTSEISVALTFDKVGRATDPLLPEECIEELGSFCKVSINRGLSLVAVIGNHTNQSGTTNATNLLFRSLGEFKIKMICHGASNHNVCFLVDENEAHNIVNFIHDQIIDL